MMFWVWNNEEKVEDNLINLERVALIAGGHRDISVINNQAQERTDFGLKATKGLVDLGS